VVTPLRKGRTLMINIAAAGYAGSVRLRPDKPKPAPIRCPGVGARQIWSAAESRLVAASRSSRPNGAPKQKG
jgi:hypothetical protein